MNTGDLVPEDVIFGLLSKRLEDGYCRGETGFILEGIPRTTVQAVRISTTTFVVLVMCFLVDCFLPIVLGSRELSVCK